MPQKLFNQIMRIFKIKFWSFEYNLIVYGANFNQLAFISQKGDTKNLIIPISMYILISSCENFNYFPRIIHVVQRNIVIYNICPWFIFKE